MEKVQKSSNSEHLLIYVYYCTDILCSAYDLMLPRKWGVNRNLVIRVHYNLAQGSDHFSNTLTLVHYNSIVTIINSMKKHRGHAAPSLVEPLCHKSSLLRFVQTGSRAKSASYAKRTKVSFRRSKAAGG
jgi:hypothetical protein